ncbi:chemotaxis protein CheX [Intestinimonas sp. HCP28S3_D6]|uniref:chemotaxis protein CheX n=1 Tax=Intestinimonas sp. HCP28S3_D6 TaxID=3438942 RepID=UPI003F8C66C9
MIPLTQNDILDILDCVMQDITNRMARIYPCKQNGAPLGDVCTVCTTFEGGYNANLILYMDTALLTKLTQTTMQEETVSLQDIEDFMKEYFNVICGHIVARLFQAAHISSRFRIPRFYSGLHLPDGAGSLCCVLSYVSGSNERAQLIHQLPAHENK